jgi:hypothetical protein
MIMRKLVAFILPVILLLALAACGAPAGPGKPADLAAFADSPLEFDLTDLAQFLSEPQLAAVETALRDNLAALGLDEYTALYFNDPPTGSVKIPFANDTGTDLSRIDNPNTALWYGCATTNMRRKRNARA